MVKGANDEQTLLLVLPSRREVWPLSPAALTQAQGSRRRLAREYRDAVIVDRTGAVRRIEHLEVLGPAGESPGRRLFSYLNSDWRITTHLSSPLSWSLEETKQTLADCVIATGDPNRPETGIDSDREDQSVTSASDLASAILAAPTLEAVFNVLKVPPPEDALDVL